MPISRKNKSKRVKGDKGAQPWFNKRVKRDKDRKKMAKQSKKRNRK